MHRSSDKEHEDLLKLKAEHPEFPSLSLIVREAVLRLIHVEGGIDSRYSEVEDVINELQGAKKRFLDLVLTHSER